MVLKNWITNGNSASVYLVIAQTDISKGSRGINAFIVEKNWPGVTVGAKENKIRHFVVVIHTVFYSPT